MKVMCEKCYLYNGNDCGSKCNNFKGECFTSFGFFIDDNFDKCQESINKSFELIGKLKQI